MGDSRRVGFAAEWATAEAAVDAGVDTANCLDPAAAEGPEMGPLPEDEGFDALEAAVQKWIDLLNKEKCVALLLSAHALSLSSSSSGSSQGMVLPRVRSIC